MITRPNVLKKRIKLAEKIAKQNGGKLFSPQKMIERGYEGLYRYIYRHPEKFNHLEVEEAFKHGVKHNFNIAIRAKYFKKAQKLASQNNGVLPDRKWLIRHGHACLVSYIKIYPQVFIHLKRSNNG